VLLLEDDPDMARSVARFLRHAGYSVDETRTLAAADERLAIHSYDVLVLDRSVPGGDALDLLTAYRGAGGSTPALFLTARDSVADRVAGLTGGAEDYLVKPFAMAELVARVHGLARRSVLHPDPVLRLADVEVDPARRRATRAGKDLGLTAKEFALLRYLVANSDRVLSRTDLIEHCWDELAEPMSNVVDVKVRQLRIKLGTPQLITTVRGEGYVASNPAE
jgi:DNA-binding response OmpR family regulator